jgi:hypothetical protein
MSGAQFDKAFATHMVTDHKKDITPGCGARQRRFLRPVRDHRRPENTLNSAETCPSSRRRRDQPSVAGTARWCMRRSSADKPARYPKEGAGIGVGGPIIAVEEGQRASNKSVALPEAALTQPSLVRVHHGYGST